MHSLDILFWTAWAFIVYTYLVFPVTLAVFARLRGEKELDNREEPAELPRVTMVVAAYNEAGVISEKLANTWALDYPADKFQLIVGSDGSGDATPELLRACHDPRLNACLFEERRGKISVLNDLVARTDADILVMSDANTMFAPDAIRKLVRHFEDPTVGCVSGELRLEQNGGVSGEGLYWKYENWIKRNESRLGFLIGCNGGIYALRRELYDALPASTIVDDFVISMRVLEKGYKVQLDPSARATEPPCPSAKAEMTRKVRIGAGGYQALGLTARLLRPTYGLCSFAFWGHKVLRWFVPVFFLVALLANVLLAHAGAYRWILAAQLAGVAIAAFAYREKSGTMLPSWTRPISYFYLMNFALVCGLLRFLFRTQRVTWDRASR